VAIPLLINDIEQAEDNESDTLIAQVTRICNDEFHPPYDDDHMKEVVQAIKDEKEKIFIKEQVEKSINKVGLTDKERGEILKRYAANRKNQILGKKS